MCVCVCVCVCVHAHMLHMCKDKEFVQTVMESDKSQILRVSKLVTQEAQ